MQYKLPEMLFQTNIINYRFYITIKIFSIKSKGISNRTKD